MNQKWEKNRKLASIFFSFFDSQSGALLGKTKSITLFYIILFYCSLEIFFLVSFYFQSRSLGRTLLGKTKSISLFSIPKFRKRFIGKTISIGWLLKFERTNSFLSFFYSFLHLVKILCYFCLLFLQKR